MISSRMTEGNRSWQLAVGSGQWAVGSPLAIVFSDCQLPTAHCQLIVYLCSSETIFNAPLA